MTEETASLSTWADDILDRKRYADFLTNFVNGKCAHDKPALVVALDAPWGYGKTFFVEHWAKDLAAAKHPVIVFNAWENDSADDPVVSFMAELRNGIEPLRETLPVGDAARTALDQKSREVVGHLRRALMPVLGVAAKAILKKATGIAADELLDAASGSDETSVDSADARDLTAETLDKSLDKFFEKALAGHSERLGSIEHFRRSLEELLILLSEKTNLVGPLYVFVDELDRCRPDYAIRLLEGIKHLFSVKGVAFIVSTNLGQLSKAVGAVYGVHFDGYMYLKRFFDIEFTLPEPTRRAFVALRAHGTVLENVVGCSGMDPAGQPREELLTITGIAHIAEAMQLDLRSIQSILSVTEAVVLGLPTGTKVATMWLFFVAAVRHSHPLVFGKLASPVHDPGDFQKTISDLLKGPSTIPSIDRRTGRVIQRHLSELLGFFETASKESMSDMVKRYNNMPEQTSIQYPNVLFQELISFNGTGNRGLHPISEYPALVALAGHVARSAK